MLASTTSEELVDLLEQEWISESMILRILFDYYDWAVLFDRGNFNGNQVKYGPLFRRYGSRILI